MNSKAIIQVSGEFSVSKENIELDSVRRICVLKCDHVVQDDIYVGSVSCEAYREDNCIYLLGASKDIYYDVPNGHRRKVAEFIKVRPAEDGISMTVNRRSIVTDSGRMIFNGDHHLKLQPVVYPNKDIITLPPLLVGWLVSMNDRAATEEPKLVESEES
ncbi:MAG: hypothetical protein CL678_15600 [Bdellovibrionaceae bacterium]|nr:hypothetical protein [Pseudobdellovibrionaceae bacterium]|tara:strand:+ start:357 stop:833 length:477 start_codon:yes stop_codon:yes gene_type:complete